MRLRSEVQVEQLLSDIRDLRWRAEVMRSAPVFNRPANVQSCAKLGTAHRAEDSIDDVRT